MYKLVLYLLLAVFFMTMYALQLDEEVSMNMLFRAKHGLNRSTHAAAQQFDKQKLAEGIMAIDQQAAEEIAYEYLQSNLKLDPANIPLRESFLESPVEVLVLEVLNENLLYPYHYVNDDFDYRSEE